MTMTTITFVRHGNTYFNAEKRAQGHMQNPLNEKGMEQAAAVAKRLAEEKWDILVSSDLMRTRQTAQYISDALSMPVDFYDERLREIGRGQIEGTIEEERIARWGQDWRKLDLGLESHESTRQRGLSFVQDMLDKYPGKKILAVSHGVLISQTLKGLMKDEEVAGGLENTSVTTVKHNGDSWEFMLFNCTKHLS